MRMPVPFTPLVPAFQITILHIYPNKKLITIQQRDVALWSSGTILASGTPWVCNSNIPEFEPRKSPLNLFLSLQLLVTTSAVERVDLFAEFVA
ncbi:hypothetical protein ONS95_001803 [Cadophora gregata]|uniref:uncharacterized protein n=1 Tax=Cadophora gregata TaxID=51156 RepID=UPI0026DA9029|nr:uncharacterized protein ONS95_001803 [Cadophora gregata]KAK0111444.1 hypothetical protein ONS95_001803 [Cadophora gregata]KAK0112079.1 hypothetical protein ONS96_001338 [Cadophora gregata f. sp. sojae]